MVDDQVLLANGGKAVIARVPDPLGKPRLEGFETQFIPAALHNLGEGGDPDDAVSFDDVGRIHAQFLEHRFPEIRRHLRIDLEPHDIAAPPLSQQRLE